MDDYPCSRRRTLQALAAGLAAWAGVAAGLDSSQFVPHGHFADLGTHNLYYDCQGQGEPRVVFDYGIAGAAVEWQQIQRELAQDTTVCVYDRAGYGWSDPGPSPRTVEQAVAELHALAALAGWTKPLLLVGHSLGGLDVRYFAIRYPASVAGLVLLESSIPGLGLRGNAAGRATVARNPFDATVWSEPAASQALAVARYLNSRRKAVFAQMDELANFEASGTAVANAGALPDRPLLVVARDPRRGLPDPGEEAIWQRAQQALATSAPRGEWWVADQSGHEVQRDQPATVISAVRRVLTRLRQP